MKTQLSRFLVVVVLGGGIFASAAPPIKKWKAHSDGVWKVEYSADKDFFLSTGGDGKVRVWWSDCLCPLTTFAHEKNYQVYDAKFISEGRILSASYDGSVFVWNRESGETFKKLEGHSLYVSRVANGLDGSRFYTAGTDEKIIEWDAKTYKPLREVKTNSPVGVIPLSLDEIVSVGLDGLVKWDLAQSKSLSALSDLPYYFAGIAGASGKIFVAGDPSRGAPPQKWDIKTGKVEQTYEGMSNPGWQLALSTDGKYFGAASFKGAVYVWDADSGKLVFSSSKESGEIMSLAFVPDAKALLLGNSDGYLQVQRF